MNRTSNHIDTLTPWMPDERRDYARRDRLWSLWCQFLSGMIIALMIVGACAALTEHAERTAAAPATIATASK